MLYNYNVNKGEVLMKNKQKGELTTIEAICDDVYNTSFVKKIEEVSKLCTIIGLILFFIYLFL